MAADLALRRVHRPALGGALVVVALQIAYPLSDGTARDVLTAAIVLALAATCIGHAAVTRGTRPALLLVAATAPAGFAAEVVGVRTGFPFGDYAYTGGLGPRVLGVPLVVAFAWTMLAWPAALAARRLVSSGSARIAVGTWALASADLFLDPQMVAAGYWRWSTPAPHLPGVPDVPLTNLAGWIAVSLVLSAAVQRVLDRYPPAADGDDTVPLLLYVWLWAGWTLALGAFLDRPAAAAWGTVGMGLVAVPVLLQWRR